MLKNCLLYITVSFLTSVSVRGQLYSPTEEDEIRCDNTIQNLQGYFTTPNYPATYPNGLDCSWNITVPLGYEILLNFTQFELEWTDFCEYDYVTVKSSNGTIGKYCGRRSGDLGPRVTVPPMGPIVIKKNSVQIVLHTDFSNEVEVHGFQAHFAAIDIDECLQNNGGCSHFCHNFIGSYYCSCPIGYQLHQNGKYCRVLCHDIHTQKHAGIITSPQYPNSYPDYAKCDWHITAEKGYFVNLEFLDFDVEKHDQSVCPYDYVSVEDEKNKYGPFCGQTLPPKFRSVTNWLIVEFFSDDDDKEYRGFKARYWLESINCPPLEAPKRGFMTGPRNFTFKETLHFSCKEGHRLSGSTSRTCQSNGKWTGTQPNCTRITCDSSFIYRLPHNAGMNDIEEPYYYGRELKIECNLWYDVVGSNILRCEENGTWSGGNADCVRTCGRSRRSIDNSNEAIETCTEGRHRANALKYSQPWLAAIRNENKVICAGILISDQWVITATHCVADTKERRQEKGSLEVILGAYDWDNIEEHTKIKKVKRIVINRHFDYALHSDITLLQLDSPLSLKTEVIQPICLGHERHHKLMFRGGRNVASIGWYSNGEKRMTDRCLQIEKNREKCKKHVSDTNIQLHKKKYNNKNGRKHIPLSDFICTYPTVGSSDNCKVLPGSSLVAYDENTQKWYLGGILSWGTKNLNECETYMNTYGVYTKIQKFMKWIKQETGLKPKDLDASSEKNRWKH